MRVLAGSPILRAPLVVAKRLLHKLPAGHYCYLLPHFAVALDYCSALCRRLLVVLMIHRPGTGRAAAAAAVDIVVAVVDVATVDQVTSRLNWADVSDRVAEAHWERMRTGSLVLVQMYLPPSSLTWTRSLLHYLE